MEYFKVQTTKKCKLMGQSKSRKNRVLEKKKNSIIAPLPYPQKTPMHIYIVR
jgi:hypothetical protein